MPFESHYLEKNLGVVLCSRHAIEFLFFMPFESHYLEKNLGVVLCSHHAIGIRAQIRILSMLHKVGSSVDSCYKSIDSEYFDLLDKVALLATSSQGFRNPTMKFVKQTIQRFTCLEVIGLDSWCEDEEQY